MHSVKFSGYRSIALFEKIYQRHVLATMTLVSSTSGEFQEFESWQLGYSRYFDARTKRPDIDASEV